MAELHAFGILSGAGHLPRLLRFDEVRVTPLARLSTSCSTSVHIIGDSQDAGSCF